MQLVCVLAEEVLFEYQLAMPRYQDAVQPIIIRAVDRAVDELLHHRAKLFLGHSHITRTRDSPTVILLPRRRVAVTPCRSSARIEISEAVGVHLLEIMGRIAEINAELVVLKNSFCN